MEETKIRQKKKVNNKGMTLVEVLVAMAVLTVVSLALLQAFVSSVTYNRDAKDKQRGINLAQSIMESYKAYKLEDVCRQFNGVDPFVIYKGSIGGYSESGSSVDINGVFTPSATNEYTFSMTDVQYDGKVYDVDITMKPNAETVSTEELTQTARFNAYNDAIFNQPADEYKYVYNDAITELQNAGMKVDLLPTLTTIEKSKIIINKRTIVINIYQNSGVDYVTAEVTYEYTFDDYEITKDDGTTEQLTSSHTVVVNSTKDATTYGVYDNSITQTAGAHLNNVYIYYYPAYNHSLMETVCSDDNIVINNNSGSVKNVYLVKQIIPGLGVGAGLFNCETSYYPSVNLNGNGINLYHNLAKNLKDDGPASYSLAYTASDTICYDLYEKKTKILVYDIEISVTDKAKGEVEIVLEGSVNDR